MRKKQNERSLNGAIRGRKRRREEKPVLGAPTAPREKRAYTSRLKSVAKEPAEPMSTKPDQINIPAQLVKELRERTGAGFSDCRAALVEAVGNIEEAINVLRKKGQPAAQKKAHREAT